MKIKLNTGLSVRTGPDDDAGNFPTRRIGKAGDVITLADVPEWEGTCPPWLLEQGLVEEVDDRARITAPLTEE